MEELLSEYFPSLFNYPELRQELNELCSVHQFPKGTELLHEGSYVKVIPLVVSGLIKVFKEDISGNEVLLYYIKPKESCIMSLTASLKNEASKIKAVVEEDAEVIALPANEVLHLSQKFPQWNAFAYDLFNLRFQELLDVVQLLTFSKKDKRLLEYLKKESEYKNTNILHLTHQEIANELGAAREVVSRLLKQLETEGAIKLYHGRIELLKH